MNRRSFIGAAGAVSGLVSGWVPASRQSASERTGSQFNMADMQSKDASGGTDIGMFDVLVCGGGPSGLAAAIQASRAGAKVLLVERYGRLGGMATLAMVHPLMGHVKSPFVDEILRRLGGRNVDFEMLDLHYADILRQEGVDILLHSWVCGAIMEGNRVAGVRLFGKDGWMQARAAVTIDATGDGDVAALAGADYEKGRTGDGLLQPMSIMYRISGVAADAFCCGSEEEAQQVKIGSKTWEQVVADGQTRGELSPTISVIRTYACSRETDRGVNATQVNAVDGTKVRDLTRAELEGRRQAQQVLQFLRKYAPGYEDAYISGMPAVIGVRESRRILGIRYLSREDVVQGRRFDDAVVYEADFPIDIHNPKGGGQAEGFAARVKPYDIPYGCLVPKNIDGLLVAGRCISGSHDAHASYRVQCIAMATGSAAGIAAAIAGKRKVAPRDIDPAEITKVWRMR